jgi:hypothetical protein
MTKQRATFPFTEKAGLRFDVTILRRVTDAIAEHLEEM